MTGPCGPRSAGGMADTRLEPLVLSEAERRTLENWAKRRKTAQGLALRARIVLACAEGGSNTAVAARLRRQPGHGDQVAGPVPGPAAGRAGRRAAAGSAAHHHRRPGGGGGGADPGRGARGRHALVQAGAGPAGGDLADQRAPHLAGVRAAAVAHRGLQDLPRPAADRQDPRRGRPVPGAAGERGGLRGRREAADPGAAADRAGAADDPRGARAAQLSTTSGTAPSTCSPR